MATTTVNNRIQDKIISRAVDLQRYDAALRQQVLEMLQRIEKKLIIDITDYDPTSVKRSDYQQKRLEALLQQAEQTIKTGYTEIDDTVGTELEEVAINEGGFLVDMIDSTIPKAVATAGYSAVAVDENLLAELAKDTMIDGSTASEWWGRQAGDTLWNFKRSMQEGVYRGEGMAKLIDRVKKSRAEGGVGMDISRQRAETLCRTAVLTVTNRARDEFYNANDELINCVQWLSTLDMRTSEPCRLRDGKKYSIPDHKPIGHALPWGGGAGSYHWNCRSTTVPVLKAAEELGFKEDGLRRSMDGLLPESTTYEDWLKAKPADIQDQILGKTKAQMWREGKIGSFRDLVDQKGNPLKLSDLKEKYARKKVRTVKR